MSSYRILWFTSLNCGKKTIPRIASSCVAAVESINLVLKPTCFTKRCGQAINNGLSMIHLRISNSLVGENWFILSVKFKFSIKMIPYNLQPCLKPECEWCAERRKWYVVEPCAITISLFSCCGFCNDARLSFLTSLNKHFFKWRLARETTLTTLNKQI